ncbi:MAG: hypothetical protein RL088_460 [Verrucomicrobiota bacterium]|jgi:NADH:ubiquinone oxidoreductase subunit F (NADH-binding)
MTKPQTTGRAAVDSFYHLLDSDLAKMPCAGTACFVAGAKNIPQGRRLYCSGRCFEAPVRGTNSNRPHSRIASREGIILGRIARGGTASLEAYESDNPSALKQALALRPEQLLDEIDTSGLRGRGGAAYPTGKKWKAVANAPTRDVKYIIANADEGDPGAFVDRFIMELDPHALIEGMTIAACAVGARQGRVYLRKEYPLSHASMQGAIDEARRAGRLGQDILGSGFAFDIQIFIGHGSYVCGEETALIHSLEGRRPEPSVRPPFPTVSGFQGRPTLVNNVETLASVPWIIRHGGAAYSALGTGTSRGTKVLSLNSLFARPGLYEVEFGTPLRTIVEELGGGLRTGPLKGLIIGGPLAGIIPPHLLDTPLGFDELRAIGASVGHGGVIGFDHSTSIDSLIHHVVEFGASESCGKCTPCALGCPELARIFAQQDSAQQTAARDRETVHSLTTTLRNASLCGHGTGVGEFIASALKHYGKELESCWR